MVRCAGESAKRPDTSNPSGARRILLLFVARSGDSTKKARLLVLRPTPLTG
jgi:hypothetical protein